jgi:transcriptional regulator with XRE-family HTH domain
MTTFSEVLARHLKEQGISQYRLAKLVGCNESTPTLWVQGKRIPTRPHVIKVADALILLGNDRVELFASAGYWPDTWPVSRITTCS